MISPSYWKEDRLPPDTLPYDEDLLRHTLGLSPRVAPHRTGSKPDFYSDSEKSRLVQTLREGALKRVRISEEAALDSEKETRIRPRLYHPGPFK